MPAIKRIIIPKQIKINAISVPILVDDAAGQRCDDAHVFGHVFAHNHSHGWVMEISNKLPEPVFSLIFLHELLEACISVPGIKMSHNTLSVVATGLHQVMEQMGLRFVRPGVSVNDRTDDHGPAH